MACSKGQVFVGCEPLEAKSPEWKLLEACLGSLKEEICLSASFLKHEIIFWQLFFKFIFG